MIYLGLAALVVLTHLAFIVFVVAGGLLVWRYPRLAWVHVPAAIWGGWIEITGRICPLTPLENALRVRAGAAGYAGDFLEHYVVAIVYPPGLTREMQMAFGVAAIGVNLVVYGLLIRRVRRVRRGS